MLRRFSSPAFPSFCAATLAALVVCACDDGGTAPDRTPPTIAATAPAAGATDVPTDAAISATFSEPLQPGSITSASFTVSRAWRAR